MNIIYLKRNLIKKEKNMIKLQLVSNNYQPLIN